MKRAASLGLLLSVWAGLAFAQSPGALDWLRKIQEATQRLSYSGTFVYQQGGRTESSRITRFVDSGGDTERLEVLDGQPREIVRTRDTVRCYLPESKVVKVDRRTPDRTFPALLPEKLAGIAAYYDLTLGETRRIAGFDCQAVVLTPKDNLRYGYKLYADAQSGMLLRAVTVDRGGETVEQFTFTQLSIGGVTRDMVKTRHLARAWRVEDAEATPARLSGWGLRSELPGFRKVSELKRRMPVAGGEAKPVGQMVFSDGLAAVSVFIEPLDAARGSAARSGLASMGAIHIYTREVANHMVTVVGEAPAASIQRIADGVEYHRPQ